MTEETGNLSSCGAGMSEANERKDCIDCGCFEPCANPTPEAEAVARLLADAEHLEQSRLDISRPTLLRSGKEMAADLRAALSTLPQAGEPSSAQRAVEPVAWTVRRAPKDDPNWDEARRMDSEVFEILTPDGRWRGCVAVDPEDARDCIRSEWDKEQAEAARLIPPPKYSPAPAQPDAGGLREAVERLEGVRAMIRQHGSLCQFKGDPIILSGDAQARDVAAIDTVLAALTGTQQAKGEVKKATDWRTAIHAYNPECTDCDRP